MAALGLSLSWRIDVMSAGSIMLRILIVCALVLTSAGVADAQWLAGGGHHALDPFVALSFVAAATTRVRLHTHILVLAYRNPFLAAKSVGYPARWS